MQHKYTAARKKHLQVFRNRLGPLYVCHRDMVRSPTDNLSTCIRLGTQTGDLQLHHFARQLAALNENILLPIHCSPMQH